MCASAARFIGASGVDPNHQTPELLRKYLLDLTMVCVLMDKEASSTIWRSSRAPERRLTPPILAALSDWTFQLAQLNDQAVALIALTGALHAMFSRNNEQSNGIRRTA